MKVPGRKQKGAECPTTLMPIPPQSENGREAKREINEKKNVWHHEGKKEGGGDFVRTLTVVWGYQ